MRDQQRLASSYRNLPRPAENCIHSSDGAVLYRLSRLCVLTPNSLNSQEALPRP
ncbi:hypothetical protein M407DRAFT_192741 [Tulasnella calospora MUT 4182]|uniref:Uncharacterized protein n=1 Tax=Tulasnella calospora MUT 4182 TaxID=1051891 RepID=A0A0C3L0Q7_9AGAM|nr:hypothetical protein M407DRAFT_192741 [Tulasnella calospora MUT 4182]